MNLANEILLQFDSNGEIIGTTKGSQNWQVRNGGSLGWESTGQTKSTKYGLAYNYVKKESSSGAYWSVWVVTKGIIQGLSILPPHIAKIFRFSFVALAGLFVANELSKR